MNRINNDIKCCYCKTSLLVKWEQDRKTQEMIDRIDKIKGLSNKAKQHLKDKKMDEINTELILNKVNGSKILDKEEKCNHRIFNYIFCDNKLLLVTQTYNRSIDNGIVVEQLSSSKDVKWHNFDDIKANWEERIGEKSDHKIDGILCCTNLIRLNDALRVVKFFNKYRKDVDNMKFRFWFDEADATICGKQAIKIVNEIRSYIDIVEEVVFITATPQDPKGGLITAYGDLSIHPLEIPTDETTYLQWKNIDKELIDQDKSQPIEFYVKKCLEKKPLIKGDLAFIPAGNTKKSHEDIAKMILEKDMADKVIVINGDDKEIRFLDDKGELFVDIKDELKKKEFSKYLEKECYTTLRADDDPENCINDRVVITGRLCIGRGISINNPNKCITRCILAETFNRYCKTMDSQYSQLGGRLGGNIMKWENYIPPFVQTTRLIDESIKIQRNMTEWLKEQDNITITKWKRQYDKECKELGIREGKTKEYGTYVFNFKTYDNLKKFIPVMNKHMKKEIDLKIKGPTKRTIERKRIDGKIPYKWDYKPKLAVRNEEFIFDKTQLAQGFYSGSFDDTPLKKVKSKKAGRAIPYYKSNGEEMWCFVTPEKYYNEELKIYNNKIISYCHETKEFEINTTQIIPAFK